MKTTQILTIASLFMVAPVFATDTSATAGTTPDATALILQKLESIEDRLTSLETVPDAGINSDNTDTTDDAVDTNNAPDKTAQSVDDTVDQQVSKYESGYILLVKKITETARNSDHDEINKPPIDYISGSVETVPTLSTADIIKRARNVRQHIGVEYQFILNADDSGRYMIGVDYQSPAKKHAQERLNCNTQIFVNNELIIDENTHESAVSVGGVELEAGLYEVKIWSGCTDTQSSNGRYKSFRKQQLNDIKRTLLIRSAKSLNLREMTESDFLHQI